MAYKALYEQAPNHPLPPCRSSSKPLALWACPSYCFASDVQGWLLPHFFYMSAQMSPPIISLTHGGWGPGRDWAVRRRQSRIGAFAVTRLEHSTCLLNEVMESFKLNLHANWENMKILSVVVNLGPLFIISTIQWLFNEGFCTPQL